MRIIVEQNEYEKRLSSCKGCKWFTNQGTCGTPIIGQTIKYKKGKKKLCGCFMRAKARLVFADCPIHKWDKQKITQDQRKWAKDVKGFLNDMEDRETLTQEEVKIVYEFHNKTHGSKTKTSSCGKCVKTALNELKDWVANIA